ncbi:MAG: helix-turn-helix domain-containing protein [Eubacterium sp.]
MKLYRKENDMTQQRLAKKAGVSSRTIIAFEKKGKIVQ